MVQFKPVEGWNVPKSLTVEVSRGKTVTATATYTKKPPPEYGSLTVTMVPNEVLDLGAQWRVANNPWKKSGQTQDMVLVGRQIITFKP